MYDAIAISDLHLGSSICVGHELLQFLMAIRDRTLPTKKLILIGDIFDTLDFRRFNATHWLVLFLLRDITKNNDIELIWVIGNHDDHISDIFGIHAVNQCSLNGILFIHGHTFDSFLTDHPILTIIGDWVYLLAQKISPRLSRWLKNNSKIHTHCTKLVAKGAKAYASKLGFTIVCCGHTHKAVDSDGYYNSGSWTESPGTYLTISNSTVQLHRWSRANNGQ